MAAKNQVNTVVGEYVPRSSLHTFVPDQLKATHKYVDNYIMTGGTGGVLGTAFQYSMNSLYDPYMSGGGHQPYGFDQLTPWYSTYVVTDVELTVTLLAPSSGSCLFVAAWNPSYGTYTLPGLGVSDYAEKDRARWITVPSYPGKSADQTTSFGRFSIGDVEGKSKKEILSELNYSAAPTGSPGNQPFFYFAVGDAAGGSATTVAAIFQLDTGLNV
jgi:hypothetical protein